MNSAFKFTFLILFTLLLVQPSFAQGGTESLSRQVMALRSAVDSYKDHVDGEYTALKTALDAFGKCRGNRVYAPAHPDANSNGCVEVIDESSIADYINSNCGLHVDNPGSVSLHGVLLNNGTVYDLYDENNSSAILKWRCGQQEDTPFIAAGALCGLKMSSHQSPVMSCGGRDPQTSCPTGYTTKRWALMGSSGGDWYSCIRDTTAIEETIVNSGALCGIKMSGHTSPVIPCGGRDPQTSCPAGYQSTFFAAMGTSGGNWHTCMKRQDSKAPEAIGSLCGLDMDRNQHPVISCGPSDKQALSLTCPTGYKAVTWAYMGSRGGNWTSCVRQSH